MAMSKVKLVRTTVTFTRLRNRLVFISPSPPRPRQTSGMGTRDHGNTVKIVVEIDVGVSCLYRVVDRVMRRC
jgi:hypothetical protein